MEGVGPEAYLQRVLVGQSSQESTQDIKEILDYLSSFKNLTIQGRNGLFEYTHTHDLLRVAKDAMHSLQHSHALPT